MLLLIIKAFIIGSIVVGGTELAKKSSLLSAVLISLPITSIVSLIFLYHHTNSIEKVATVSMNIFWMVLPSLIFFLVFAFLLKNNFRFYSALGVSVSSMVVSYFVYSFVLNKLGISV